MGVYSEEVLDHFHRPRHAGEIEHPSAVVEASNPACGDVLKLSALVQGQILIQVRFKAAGCVPAIACGSWLTEYLEAKHLDDVAPLPPISIEKSLGGLPGPSHHAAVLAAEAMQRLLHELKKMAR